MPTIIPHNTCSFVWPTNVLKCSSLKASGESISWSSFDHWFIVWACFPVSSLTFIASLKTINAKRRAKTNCVEPYPFIMPMEFAKAATDAEWLDGIPPLVKKGWKLHFLLINASTKHFASCAENIAISVDQKTGFMKILSFTSCSLCQKHWLLQQLHLSGNCSILSWREFFLEITLSPWHRSKLKINWPCQHFCLKGPLWYSILHWFIISESVG